MMSESKTLTSEITLMLKSLTFSSAIPKPRICIRQIAASISVLAVFKIPLFFTISGLLGYEYAGSESSSIYMNFIISVFILTFLAYVFSFLIYSRVRRAEAIFYGFIFWIILNHTLWALCEPTTTDLMPRNLILFVSLALPGLFAARLLRVMDAWKHFIKLVEPASIIMALGVTTAIVFPFISGVFVRGIGGTTYQSASYFAAFAFGLLGFYTFRAEKSFRYKLTNNIVGNSINVILMICLFLATVLNGGRGAFLLLLIYNFVFFYWIVKKNLLNRRRIWKGAIFLASFPLIFYASFQTIIRNSFLASGFARATSFIGGQSGGILNWETGSSQRDIVYGIALDGISNSPLLGYGALAHWDKVIPPHNIFLDLSLQFGVPFAAFIIIGLTVWMLKSRKPWDTRKVFLVTILMYPLVVLTFSGGYLQNVVTWFGLASYLSLEK